jgi:hypothetical protein
MKNAKVIVSLVAGLVVGLCVGVGVGTPKRADAQAQVVGRRQQWEYQIVRGSTPADLARAQEALNRAGGQGYEYAGTLWGQPDRQAFGVLLKRAK